MSARELQNVVQGMAARLDEIEAILRVDLVQLRDRLEVVLDQLQSRQDQAADLFYG